jgi:hypothetical protein
LSAEFSKRHASADFRNRSNLDRPDETFEHLVKQFDLLGVQATGGRQKKICDTPDTIEAFFRRTDFYGRFDFFDNG